MCTWLWYVYICKVTNFVAWYACCEFWDVQMSSLVPSPLLTASQQNGGQKWAEDKDLKWNFGSYVYSISGVQMGWKCSCCGTRVFTYVVMCCPSTTLKMKFNCVCVCGAWYIIYMWPPICTANLETIILYNTFIVVFPSVHCVISHFLFQSHFADRFCEVCYCCTHQQSTINL